MPGSERIYGHNIPHHALEQCLEAHKASIPRALEINIPFSQQPANIFPSSRISSILQLREQTGTQLSFHVPFKVNITEKIPRFRKLNAKYLLSCLDIAAELEVQMVTVHLGTFYWFPVEQQTRKKALDRFVKHIDPILDACENHGLDLALENVVRLPKWSEYYHLGDSPEDFGEIFNRIESPRLGFCLDTGHANIGGYVGDFIQALGGHLTNMHIHDNLGDDDNHLMLGEGSIDWPDVTGRLKALGYNGPFISECRHRDPEECFARLERYFYNASPVNS